MEDRTAMAKVVILGMGIAGLSLGWALKKYGIDFAILEKQAYIGGLARQLRVAWFLLRFCCPPFIH